ncbi:rhamnose utilization protein RhaD (predicted bifunctional aldolase and dehydrogenase) [Rhizobium sp. PP-F2F-G38]|uniref:Bifunctional aldolase/short-chain dehydrogenase n=1 Tax=Ferranicluibacter rubi TaxID=2715133 RepID=A0AA44CBW0_9HYPH|nr:bifunctional aldolase/short-chain dehydrogenase [Ferranicluibacter rubi]PYE32566.1 rhamnose utilization protein RhaD (predicted bifunctional aldolase and dehydrogenase) [Rhizobium sp. PP-WC-1G-195]PYE95995.1 rhamnose utilization protein RhaD (predicted bifunctional aldolase and dehydrogenase) [Rhizobium sp. PP-F2F-G38]TCP88400.1 rhamnose utilization protein RhaD (predicted bifunctional aldolase and dehydrogenase) [Rhizobium sp. PP-CC-2G-626]TCQ22935.1 rhamnose utilization protein RhaD (predi
MRSRWSDTEFKAVVDAYVAKGINRDLAIRTYTTRLLGQDPELVLHGGGNTSVKTVFTEMDGTEIEVLCVKGSGWDMGTIEPQGLPAVRLEPLKAMVAFDTLSDDDMVMLQRRLLLDPSAPNPSVEAILHGLLPFKHIDHTHANAIVSLTNQPNGEALVRELFPNAIIVPYVMPGFDLAKACDAAFKANPGGDGMILLKHGIFTWSEDPRTSYEDMIAKIDAAEKRIAKGNPKPFRGVTLPRKIASAAEIAPILRGAIALSTEVEGAPRRFVLEHRSSEKILDFCNAETVSSLVRRGNATPEHVIHIKRFGVALPAPETGTLDAWAETVTAAVKAYQEEYKAYFERNNARVGGGKRMLDPMPRVFYVAGVGLFAAGAARKNALVGADVAEATIAVITNAEGIDAFEALSEADLFDIEYWSLEQVKLAKSVEKPLTRQVAIVTGGASGLGLAVAEALKAEGAEIALFDISPEGVAREAKRIGAFPVVCDVTDPDGVDAAVASVAAHFGGVDILISNAGAAFQGSLLTVSEDTFRKAFDLNFWGHHYMARAVVRVMEQQKTGGALVFNVSKQAVNPGADFGPYGTSKAALMALMRQYAVEHGASGITSNAVNADRIRTGLMTDEMVAARSKARGVTPEAYLSANLVGREVTAADVAAAFVHLAKARTSSGAVITVDGGNVAAMMR